MNIIIIVHYLSVDYLSDITAKINDSEEFFNQVIHHPKVEKYSLDGFVNAFNGNFISDQNVIAVTINGVIAGTRATKKPDFSKMNDEQIIARAYEQVHRIRVEKGLTLPPPMNEIQDWIDQNVYIHARFGKHNPDFQEDYKKRTENA